MRRVPTLAKRRVGSLLGAQTGWTFDNKKTQNFELVHTQMRPSKVDKPQIPQIHEKKKWAEKIERKNRSRTM
jgi:hypothetical protein